MVSEPRLTEHFASSSNLRAGLEAGDGVLGVIVEAILRAVAHIGGQTGDCLKKMIPKLRNSQPLPSKPICAAKVGRRCRELGRKLICNSTAIGPRMSTPLDPTSAPLPL